MHQLAPQPVDGNLEAIADGEALRVFIGKLRGRYKEIHLLLGGN